MKKTTPIFLLAAAAIAALLLQTGCTLIGLAVGAHADNRQPIQETTLQGMELLTIKPDTRLTVYLHSGETLTGRYYRAIKTKDSVASNAMIQIKPKNSPNIQIPIEQIDHVLIPRRKHTGMIIGAITGLVLDAGLVILALNSIADAVFSGLVLCPYGYSFDGKEYHLEAELCSGAFYPAAQRSDWSALRHLRPANGVYKVKLANKLQETDRIDQLGLLLFDHAPGARVCPAPDGAFFEISAPQPPRTARTPGGTDMTQALRLDDSDYWVNSPLGRTAGTTLPNDEVELQFDPPAGAAAGVLLIRLRNTLWAANRHRAWLELQGGQALSDWYAELSAHASAREALNQMLSRECNLQVQVWDGAAWHPAGEVPMVGPAVDKEIALEIKLPDMTGKTLRLRLVGPAGYWMVSNALVDFSCKRVQPSFQLEPDQALRPDGMDVAARLNQADGAFATLAAQGDEVEVRFPCPALPSGQDRTAVLHCNAYYTVDVPAGNAPQTALFHRLICEPGAYRSWCLQTLETAYQAYQQQHTLN